MIPVVRREGQSIVRRVCQQAIDTKDPTIHCNYVYWYRQRGFVIEKSNNHASCRWFHSTTTTWEKGGKNKQLLPTKMKNKKHLYSKSKHSNKNQETRNGNPFRNIPDPVEQQRKEAKVQQEVPPAYLVKTASDYAYIAKCAIMDESTGELHVDPRTLFSEIIDSNHHHRNNSSSNDSRHGKQQHKRAFIPQTFHHSHFHYFPPSTFPNFEPPTDGKPEVAFLGRSNTGKSSLINALSNMILRAGRGGGSGSGGSELARTSKKPGRTQTINYFGLIPNNSVASSTSFSSFKGHEGTNTSQSEMYLVDLPGFGYASAPDEDVDAWQERTQSFLISRSRASNSSEGGGRGSEQSWTGVGGSPPPLKRLYLLLDSRLPQPTLLDLSVMGWCDDFAIPYTLVLTKVDGSSRAHCVRLTNQLCMRYHSLYFGRSDDDDDDDGEIHMDPVVYWTSSRDGLGMEELLISIENNMFSVEDDEQ